MASAEDVHRELAATTARLRSNRNLSDEGRKKLMATAYLKAQQKLGAMQQTQRVESAKTRNELERKLFGLPSGRSDPTAIVSYRDAMDRAATIKTAEEAEALLRRAELSGDDQLSRAVLGRAFEAGWQPVVDAFVDARPDDAATVDGLISINATDSRAAGRAEQMATKLAYSASRPQELAGVNEALIEMLARDAASVVEIPWSPEPANAGGLEGGSYRLAGDTHPSSDGWI